MRTFIILSFFVISFQLSAQTKQYVVSGSVSDENELPIAYVSVVLKAINTSFIQGDLTDEQGKFNVRNLSDGDYLLTVSFVGYQPYTQEIEVNNNIELPQIQLLEGIELGEVIVSAQRKLVSSERGKINLAVENSKLADLPATTDVLSFVPGVIVQASDISVIGKGKPLIFINGKEVKSTGQIESLQPEMIKNITLDRNPSAKYDASYNSVIHITTKRNLGKDFSAQYIQGGAVSHNFGHSETLNLNQVSGKFSNFLSYKFKNSKNTESVNTYQQILLNDDLQMNGYDATMQDNNNFHSLILGSNVKLNDKNTIDIQYLFNDDHQNANITGLETMEGFTNRILNVKRTGYSKEQDHTINLSYSLDIDSIRSLQFFGDYTRKTNASIEGIISESQPVSLFNNDTINNHSSFDTYSLRAEYNATVFSNYDLALGTRYSVIKSNAKSGMNGDNTVDFFNNQSTLTETTTAAYTTLSRQFTSFYTELGLRAEFNNNKYLKNGVSVFDKPHTSTHFFPSLLFNYDFSENVQLNLNYTSKITRPSFYDLDPTIYYLSSVLYEQGNPELKPTIDYIVELTGVIKRNFSLSAAYKIQRDLIVLMIEPNSENKNILLNRPINIPKSSSLDFTATYTASVGSVTSNLTGNLSIPFVEYPYQGKMQKNNLPLYQFIAINRYSISPSLFLFCNFGFNSKHSSIHTIISPTYRLTTGINWVAMKGKMIVTLFGNDLLHKSEPATASKYGLVEFGQSANPDTRMLGITLKYNFNGFKNRFKRSDSNQPDLDRITK
jgi:outer membrane receptor protein involved in Fe transport